VSSRDSASFWDVGAGGKVRTEARADLILEVPTLPCGDEDLAAFGPNGPPINILDFCPITERLFVANQRTILGFSFAALHALHSGKLVGDHWTCQARLLSAQANRLRCGHIERWPVTVTVDAQGGVIVVPCDAEKLEVAIALKNRHTLHNTAVSTWGIALAREPIASVVGDLLVSANDYTVKGWKLLPPPEPNVLGGASHSLRPRPKWTVIGGGPHNKEPRTVLMHQGNLPSIDLAEGRVVSASLDGWVGLADCTVKTPRHSTPAGDQSGASSLADAITRSSLDAASRSLPTVCGAAHEFRAPGATMWGACWLPLHSVRSVATPPTPTDVGLFMEWSTGDVKVHDIILVSSVLPFFTASELLAIIQTLSVAHALSARLAVSASSRTEQLVMSFSPENVWLFDTTLSVVSHQQLPFDAAFAHICFSPELSTAVLSTKMEGLVSPENGSPANDSIWLVTVWRRARSLRFTMSVQRAPVPSPINGTVPSPCVIGSTCAPGGRYFILLSNGRLLCYRFQINTIITDVGSVDAVDVDPVASGGERGHSEQYLR